MDSGQPDGTMTDTGWLAGSETIPLCREIVQRNHWITNDHTIQNSYLTIYSGDFAEKKSFLVFMEHRSETGEVCITFSQGGQVVGIDPLNNSGNDTADTY